MQNNSAKHGEIQWKVGFQTGEIFPLKNRELANDSKRFTNYVAPWLVREEENQIILKNVKIDFMHGKYFMTPCQSCMGYLLLILLIV